MLKFKGLDSLAAQCSTGTSNYHKWQTQHTEPTFGQCLKPRKEGSKKSERQEEIQKRSTEKWMSRSWFKSVKWNEQTIE